MRLYDLTRRTPHLVVAMIYLWTPLWIVAGLLAGTPALYATLILAAAPLFLAPLWGMYYVMRDMEPTQRAWVLFGIVLFMAFCFGLNLGPASQY